MAALPASSAHEIVVLESGDRMSQPEFHRRYCASKVTRAELIEGVVYVSSPQRSKYHGRQENELGAWVGVYRARRADVSAAHNSTLILDADNEVQPDVTVWREGGGAYEDADGYIRGAPELVIEIAASSRSIDLGDKMRAYRRNGVREYIVWRVLDGELDWFLLRDAEYARLAPDAEGVIESEAFPGLRLPVAALLAGDLAAVLAALPAPHGD